MDTVHLWLGLMVVCTLGQQAYGAVYKPTAPLLVNSFVGANESWFQFPESAPGSNYSMPSVISRPRFAIALSGGGMRAATVGLGMLRGLHQVGSWPACMQVPLVHCHLDLRHTGRCCTAAAC